MGTIVMEREYREVDRFEVETDEGEIFMVVKHQPITKTRNHGGTSIARGKPMPLLRLGDGRAINQIDSETLQIADTKQIIRKI